MRSSAKMALRLSSGLAATAGLAVLVFLILTSFDLRAFELIYLWRLVGPSGVLLASLGVVAGLWLTYFFIALARTGRMPPLTRGEKLIATIGLVVFAWSTEWILLERPITVAVADALRPDSALSRARQQVSTMEILPLREALQSKVQDPSLAIMSARIAVNRPDFFEPINVAATLSREAKRAGIDPIILFYWLYQTSFYGEASSGPLPFFSEMTGETFRDVVQAHLPSWFVESSIRRWLIQDDLLETLFGTDIGWKLRYALQKATLDISSDPFNANTFSDAYVVMSSHRDEFNAELVDPTNDALTLALRESFHALRDRLQLDACSVRSPASTDFRHFRQELVTFARAVYYKLIFDFEFATRVQALVVADALHAIERSLAIETWQGMSIEQRLGIVAMTRDVYVPNVGRISTVPYLLPELNCAPLEFIRLDAAKSPHALVDPSRFWRPEDPEKLWAAPAFMVRVFSEVWLATRGVPIADVHPERTTEDSLRVIVRNLD